MSKETATFPGTLNFLMVRQNDYGKYTVDFYPDNADVRRAVKATGIKNGIREDKEGNFYYRFYSTEPFSVCTPDGEPVRVLVGNGSHAQLRLEVEKFESAKHGTVTRSKVIGIVVDKLIEYKRPAAAPTPTELPA
jgi:hypothetical protein